MRNRDSLMQEDGVAGGALWRYGDGHCDVPLSKYARSPDLLAGVQGLGLQFCKTTSASNGHVMI